MPKPGLSSDYQAAVEGFNPKLATCLKVTPNHGSPIGFTTCDADLEIGGVLYDSDNGVRITFIESAKGTEIERMKFEGVLGGVVTKDDLRRGYWLGAAVEVFNVTFDNLARGTDPQCGGFVGEVRILSDVAFEAEIRDWMQLAAAPANRALLQFCPFLFGGTQCGFNVATKRYTKSVTFVSADGRTVRFAAQAGAKFGRGLIQALGGSNVGVLPIQIKSHAVVGAEDEVVLTDRFPMALTVGTSVQVTEGCDHTPARCQELGNYARFGGHANLPGEDKLRQTVDL